MLYHFSLHLLLKQIVRHSIKSQHANVHSTSSTPPLSGNRNRCSSRSSAENSPLATSRVAHEKPKRSSQLSIKSNTHTATSKAEQQHQQSNLVSHNQTTAPQPVSLKYQTDYNK